ncbi:MAG: hypothetical protein IPO91_03530 [Chloroflexi bacterium]|nr:hypothetical protein [Chloroflexota bacterium]
MSSTVAAAGKDMLAGLAAETTDVALLTVPSISDEGVKGGIGAAKVDKTVRVEAGMTVRIAVFGAPALGLLGRVGWRNWARRHCTGVSST